MNKHVFNRRDQVEMNDGKLHATKNYTVNMILNDMKKCLS